MSDAQKPVEATPAVAPATETAAAPAEAAAAATTETPAAETAQETAAENTEAAPAVAEAKDETPAEQAKEEKKDEVTPATEGQLGYKAPGLVKGLRFSKRFFYFQEEPVESKNLTTYHQNEKTSIANPVAAWASQTGKGLLFLTKRAEDKATPAGILNLADAGDVSKEGANEFLFKVNGVKHTFLAANTAERDSWVAGLEANAAEGKAQKETVTSSEGYKAELEKLRNPGAAAAAAAAEKKPAAENKEESKKDDQEEQKEEKKDEAAPAEENKENKEATESKDIKDKSAKSRSQSRKRTSIFGTLLGKKDESEQKKGEKAEETKPAEAKETPAETTEATETPAEAAPVAESAEAAEKKDEENKKEKTEEKKEEPKEEKTDDKEEKKTTEAPAKSKRASLFGGFFQKVGSPTQEKSEKEAAAPAAEPAAVASTAPQLDNPVEGAAGTPIEPETVTAVEGEAGKDSSAAQSPATETPGGSKDKANRRTSFFGNFGKKKGESSDTEETDAKKANKLGGLFRKPSKAVKLDNKKEDAAAETEAKPEPITKDAPAEEKPAEEAQAAEAPAATEEAKANNVPSSTPVQAAA